MSNYPTLEQYLAMYKDDAWRHGLKVEEKFAIPLLEDMKSFLDLVYLNGSGAGDLK